MRCVKSKKGDEHPTGDTPIWWGVLFTHFEKEVVYICPPNKVVMGVGVYKLKQKVTPAFVWWCVHFPKTIMKHVTPFV
jgi:hypothetical protein